MAKDLITLAEYKTYAGLTQPNQDSIIASLIPQVSSLVKKYCRTTFVDYVDDFKVETFNGGSDKLVLSEGPILSINSVEYSSDYGDNYTELVQNSDYVYNIEEECIMSIATSFPRAINGYKVTYSAGYEELPEDLKLAVMDLVTYYLKNDMAVHSPKAPGTNSVQIEYITTSSLPSHIRRVLDLYKYNYA